MHKCKNRTIIIIFSIIILILTVFSIHLFKMNVESSIKKLGYTKEETTKIVSYTNMFTIEDSKTSTLNSKLDDLVQSYQYRFNKSFDLSVIDNLNLLDKVELLQQTIQDEQALILEDIKGLEQKLVSNQIEIPSTFSVNDFYSIRSELQILLTNHFKEVVIQLGGLHSTIDEAYSDDFNTYISNLETAINVLIDQRENLGYYFEREQAMVMFEQVNAYRESQGLAPYIYSHENQACVDVEAVAYATNKNPHNWLCTLASNENAGISSVNSNYVAIAMDFFITDPPHHAVLVGNYAYASVSIVIQNGVAYMILDVF